MPPRLRCCAGTAVLAAVLSAIAASWAYSYGESSDAVDWRVLTECLAMSRLLHVRVPLAMLWTLAGLLIAGCLGSYEVAFRPYNGIRVGSLQSEARSALPVGSSREQVVAWLDANGLPYKPVHDKGGEFLWYLVRMQNGSWMRPHAGFWMTFGFDAAERLSEISAGQD